MITSRRWVLEYNRQVVLRTEISHSIRDKGGDPVEIQQQLPDRSIFPIIDRRAVLRICCGICGAVLSTANVSAGSDPSSSILDSCVTGNSLPKDPGPTTLDSEYMDFCKPHIQSLSDILGVSPAFYVLLSPDYDLKAYAIPATQKRKETVGLGYNLIVEQSTYVFGDIVLGGIIAHEYGHIVQFKSGRFIRRSGIDKSDSAFELEADFISGYYLGNLRRRDNFDFESFLTYIGNRYDALEVDIASHGSIGERTKCIQRGFSIGFQTDLPNGSDVLREAVVQVHDVMAK